MKQYWIITTLHSTGPAMVRLGIFPDIDQAKAASVDFYNDHIRPRPAIKIADFAELCDGLLPSEWYLPVCEMDQEEFLAMMQTNEAV